MEDDIRVKDIMNPIEEYDTVDINDTVCKIFSKFQESDQAEKAGKKRFHKTVFVTERGKIVGKIALFNLVRALVPESSKQTAMRAYQPILSARASRVAEEIAEIQERFRWLDNTFVELVRQQAGKKVCDIMTPAEGLLKEDDTLNWAIYTMFRADVRQPLVARNGKIVGVVNLMVITRKLLDVIGPQCALL